MNTSNVRTRFAPSPTGYLHVGGVRTAAFSWLLARHFGGKFLLRIEDTDQERLVKDGVRAILQSLQAMKIDVDEGPSHAELKQAGFECEGIANLGGDYGPYIQTLRLERYRAVAEQLVASGHAYRCDCTPEMLEKERLEQMARREQPGYSGYCRHRNVSASSKHVVRLILPERRPLSYVDAIKGRVSWDSISLRDPVLFKSTGIPTYHLAVVVDDHDMQITHALRGDEWLGTTPIHLLVYEALGWQVPVLGHVPKVLGTDGKKLSKRHGAASVEAFLEMGYLPDALFNFLVLIGWNPGAGEEQEIFAREELIKRFSLEQVNSADGVFDTNKLDWMNGNYIRLMPVDEFVTRAAELCAKAGQAVNLERLKVIAPHVQPRIKALREIPEMVDFLFATQIKRDLPAMYGKGVDVEVARRVLSESEKRLRDLPEFSHESLEHSMRALSEELQLKAGPMFGVIRIAVTGKKVTPPLFESIVALGREDTLRRLVECKAELG